MKIKDDNLDEDDPKKIDVDLDWWDRGFRIDISWHSFWTWLTGRFKKR